jgi:4-diphosphocytidyl-2-C-methyl-D-erythritol kinase
MREAFAPAKVNLFLHVGAPGADGYHPLCSLMAFADIGDRMTMTSAEAMQLAVRGPFADGAGPVEDNLVMRAANAFVAEARRPVAPVRFTLDKQLPVASGLGGGSSDAGAALRLLAEEAGMDDARLEAVAAGLGADAAACLRGRPVIAEGRGERLSPAPGLPELHAVLVNPRVAVATPAVYAAFDAAGRFGDVAVPRMPEAFESPQELAGWLASERNDLEAAAIAVCTEVGAVLDTLRDEPEALIARVSGSGGTCFAICADDITAEGLAERIEGIAPAWWVRRCRLGGPWPD